jgi:hypothetical protein
VITRVSWGGASAVVEGELGAGGVPGVVLIGRVVDGDR